MRNIKNKIKQLAVKWGVVVPVEEDKILHYENTILAALAHYCEKCNIGFKYTNGKKSHDRNKHKDL